MSVLNARTVGEDRILDKDGFPARRNELLVVHLDKRQEALAVSLGFEVKSTRHLKAMDVSVTRLIVPSHLDTKVALEALRARDPKIVADLDYYYVPASAQADTKNSEAAHPSPTTLARPARPLTIGMIDTGVSAIGPLGTTRISSKAFSTDASKGSDHRHGTAVAYLLRQGGATEIYSADVFTQTPQGAITSALSIAEGLDWLVQSHVSVINISLAGPKNLALDKIVSAITARGFIVVAAVGNAGPTSPPLYPAASDGVIGVTAVDDNMGIYRYANQGTQVLFSAKGVHVPVLQPDGQLVYESGTSFASPIIAIQQAHCLTKPSVRSAKSCLRILEKKARDLGDKGWDPVYGFGFVP